MITYKTIIREKRYKGIKLYKPAAVTELRDIFRLVDRYCYDALL